MTCDLLVAVLGQRARCYQEQEMFMEAENCRVAQLSLLNEKPEENKGDIATGQTCGLFWTLYAFTLLLVCCSITQLSLELSEKW